MKKILSLLIAVICCVLFPSMSVYGEYTYDDTLSEFLKSSGAEDLLQNQEFIPEDVDFSDTSALTGMTFTGFLQKLWNMAIEEIQSPVKTLSLCMGVIILSAMASGLQTGNGKIQAVYEVLCILCASGIASEPVTSAFVSASGILERSADFMLAFSGIFGGILTVSGGLTTATVYQSSIVALCEIAMHIATKVLIPLLRMCLAMCIVDAVNPAVSLQGFIQLIQKVTAWILGLMMAVFLGMLTVQSLVAVSADRAGTKAVKYVISGAVPIIGGAVSDAYSAVLGSVGILRSGVGMVGILALCSLFMPALLNLGIYRLLMAVSSAVSGLFMADGLTRFFKNVECILATGFSVAVSFSVMFVFSSASVLLISGTLSP